MAKRLSMTSVKNIKIKSVELYLNECYSCRSDKYQAIIDWYVSLELPLKYYQVHRIPLDRGLIRLARSYEENEGIKPPFVVIITDKGEKLAYEYQRFVREVIPMFDKAKQDKIRNQILMKPQAEEIKEKRTKTKKANVKKSETISTAIEE